MRAVNTVLEAEARNVRAARAFVEETLRGWGQEPLCDVAMLLTSELVTNSILHAHSPVSVSIELAEGSLRVAVSDDGNGMPVRRESVADATSGRGLALVDVLADDWGVDATPDSPGKTVWFRLRA